MTVNLDQNWLNKIKQENKSIDSFYEFSPEDIVCQYLSLSPYFKPFE